MSRDRRPIPRRDRMLDTSRSRGGAVPADRRRSAPAPFTAVDFRPTLRPDGAIGSTFVSGGVDPSEPPSAAPGRASDRVGAATQVSSSGSLPGQPVAPPSFLGGPGSPPR